MALIEFAYATGQTLYALARNDAGDVWNGSAFVTYNVANWTTYDIALTEMGASGLYSATAPTGARSAAIYLQAGGTPDVTDAPPVGAGTLPQGIADALLSRDMAVSRAAVASVPARSPLNAHARLVNREKNLNNVLGIYAEDDTTIVISKTLTGNAAAVPTVEADPA